ncbi:NADP-dependent oxidoreductase domain-containing protein [Lactarius quietus]|nr:NADP-dependent oxidoreductase domain-containing protein [Lactarius quietus]
MVRKTAKLGGTASGIVIGKVAHGLLSMTWRWPGPVPDEEAFAAIKAGVDALPPGTKLFLNSAEFYGQGLSTANLELLARFFEKYPTMPIDLPLCQRRHGRKIRSYWPVRSQRGNYTRAHKVMPVAAVEIEVSLQFYGQQTKDAIAACKELAIPVIAYSPLGHGLLTGHIKSQADLPEGDGRRKFSRFQDENIGNNLQLVDSLSSIAARKGITLAQLCIAWVGALGDHVIPLPGSSNAKRTLENMVAGDMELSAEELAEIGLLLERYPTKGGRYMDGLNDKQLLLWN